MPSYHDKWYTRMFSNPKIVEDLLRSFVTEDFVKDLDFTSLKKLNGKFVPVSGNSRHADIVYEIKSHGISTFIYIFLEFQSTVDYNMAMRMARYMLEFYQENEVKCGEHYCPPFAILIYSGNSKWTAPGSLRDLFIKSVVPNKYIPDFHYFKIAINEISKRDLVRIRSAVSAIFYVENSTPEEIASNYSELFSLFRSIIEKDPDAVRVVDAIVEHIYKTQKIENKAPIINSIDDLVEAESMWEMAVKEYQEKIRAQGKAEGIEQGIEKGIEQGIEKGIEQGIEKGIEQGIEKGIEQGIEKGIEQGIEKGKIEDAQKMIKMGLPIDQIVQITGLDKSKIERLKLDNIIW